MKPEEKLFNIYDAPGGVTENSNDILRNYQEDYAGWRFCTECFDNIISTVSNGNYSGEEARKYIEQKHQDRPEDFYRGGGVVAPVSVLCVQPVE